jgi:predicted RNA-binding protein with PIN domain
MALARILVDGYSLLHKWGELAPGHPRYAESARDELVETLTHYQDLTQIPVTVFFDGSGPKGGPRPRSRPKEVEILYSRAGQTADQMIERTTLRLLPYGEVLVVTDDYVERDTVIGLGGMAVSCMVFIEEYLKLRGELQREIKSRNLREKRKFGRSRTT